MNRLNRLHAEQQQVCSSIWGQQLRTSGHQTESSSVLQEDRMYPSIEVVAPKRTNASPYNSRADTQALPHEATCTPASRCTCTCIYYMYLLNTSSTHLPSVDFLLSRVHCILPKTIITVHFLFNLLQLFIIIFILL